MICHSNWLNYQNFERWTSWIFTQIENIAAVKTKAVKKNKSQTHCEGFYCEKGGRGGCEGGKQKLY